MKDEESEEEGHGERGELGRGEGWDSSILKTFMSQHHTLLMEAELYQCSKHNRTTPTQTSPIRIYASQHKDCTSHSFSGGGGQQIFTPLFIDMQQRIMQLM